MNKGGSDFQMLPVERVLKAARSFPDNIALELHDASITYRELTESAAAVAESLGDLKDDCPYVAVMADKSLSCFAGILGILMAGKAYLPVNPRFPAGRNAFMLNKARIRTIIAGNSSDDVLDDILDTLNQSPFIVFSWGRTKKMNLKLPEISSPAYLLFTSGTTGKPKGVSVSNRNLSAYLGNMLNSYDFNPDDRFTQNFDLTFDLSIHDIFLAWSTGACLCVPRENSSLSLARFIREKQPTVWFSVPSAVMMMERMRLLKENNFPSVRLSFFCGEALPVRIAGAWQRSAPESRIINLYGPTETTIAITGYEMAGNPESWKSDIGIVSIGRIFDGNSILLDGLDDSGKGELCISGAQVTGRYFENEEADRDAYFNDPATNRSFYRTGDIVWQDDEGDLFFSGRKDSEVKIAGYRVNLKEIENVTMSYPGVAQSIAVHDQSPGNAGLILLFVLASDEVREKVRGLDEYCREHLPWYMVPGKVIFVDEIPLNANGKTDVTALRLKYATGK